MKLTYYSGISPNFGDELNSLLWQNVLPKGFLDEDEKELFIGIGSIIWNSYPSLAVKHVMGSGYGGYTDKPEVKDGTWNVVFVRGPITATLLNLPSETAVCDSAIMLPLHILPEAQVGLGISFMPHFESALCGLWKQACDLAGLNLIDPRDDITRILSQIRGSRVLITEAMHGAIVADMLGVPWIAVKPQHHSHHLKWNDWAGSLDIELRSHRLWPSSTQELIRLVNPEFGLWRARKLNDYEFFRSLSSPIYSLAALRLTQMAKLEPQLSRRAKLDSVKDRALSLTQNFVRNRGFETTLRTHNQ